MRQLAVLFFFLREILYVPAISWHIREGLAWLQESPPALVGAIFQNAALTAIQWGLIGNASKCHHIIWAFLFGRPIVF